MRMPRKTTHMPVADCLVESVSVQWPQSCVTVQQGGGSKFRSRAATAEYGLISLYKSWASGLMIDIFSKMDRADERESYEQLHIESFGSIHISRPKTHPGEPEHLSRKMYWTAERLRGTHSQQSRHIVRKFLLLCRSRDFRVWFQRCQLYVVRRRRVRLKGDGTIGVALITGSDSCRCRSRVDCRELHGRKPGAVGCDCSQPANVQQNVRALCSAVREPISAS